MDLHDNSHHLRFVQSSRDALAHHRGLKSTIDALASFATDLSETSRRELNEHIQALKEHAAGFSDFLSDKVPTIYFNEHRAEKSSTIAEKVFAVPELLEHILGLSDLGDILAVCGVNHTLRGIVEASPILQVKLCYKPIDASKESDIERTTAFDMKTAVARRSSRSDWRDLKIWIETDIEMGLPGNKLQNAIVHFGYNATVYDLPKIGTAWQRMSICQPPVEEMSVHWHCSLHPRGFRNRSKVHSKTGLTVGDLYAKAVEILGDGTTCTACKGGEPIEDWDTRGTGNGEIRIKFETPVKGKPTSWIA